MTHSFVQCDTKGQSWLRSLLLPSVHLDAEKGQCCGDYMINKKGISYRNIHFGQWLVQLFIFIAIYMCV